jgi:hypothetical protein
LLCAFYFLQKASLGDGTTTTLGSNTTGFFGPVSLGAGLADSDYNVTVTVRVFDSLGAFTSYIVTPTLQVSEKNFLNNPIKTTVLLLSLIYFVCLKIEALFRLLCSFC